MLNKSDDNYFDINSEDSEGNNKNAIEDPLDNLSISTIELNNEITKFDNH